jgi:protein ImuB
MRYAVLHIQNFHLQSALRLQPSRPGMPCALIDDSRRPSRILEVNTAAAACGISPGFTATQARARCENLLLVRRCLSSEKSACDLLLDVCLRISPRVEETAPGIRTIDLAGSDPSTDWQVRAAEILPLLSEEGLDASFGVGSTPIAALYAARCSPPVCVLGEQEERRFIGRLPIREAGPDEEQARILAGWGVRTLGDLSDLPASEVARRLGKEGVALWQRACGGSPRPLRCAEPPQRLLLEYLLPTPAETLAPILHPLRRMLRQLCLRLQAAGQVAARVDLYLDLEPHEDRVTSTPGLVREPATKPGWSCSLAPPHPSHAPEVLMRLLQTKLDSLRTDAPILSLSIELHPTSAAVRQLDCFDPGLRDPAKFAETLAALAAIVGEDRIGTPIAEDSHRPDAFRLARPSGEGVEPSSRPFGNTLTANLAADAAADTPPLRRFRPPLRAEVRCSPEGRPCELRHDLAAGRVVTARGPWRNTGGWWESGRAWAREEWDLELSDGSLLRVHHDRNAWFIEGTYS